MFPAQTGDFFKSEGARRVSRESRVGGSSAGVRGLFSLLCLWPYFPPSASFSHVVTLRAAQLCFEDKKRIAVSNPGRTDLASRKWVLWQEVNRRATGNVAAPVGGGQEGESSQAGAVSHMHFPLSQF